MVVLNADHPDIEEFIWCKAKEEKKAWTLIDAGYDPSFTGEVYSNIFFQNANNSVRVTDEFMQAVIEDKEWHTRAVTTGEIAGTYRAHKLLHMIAESTWLCGDPGLQFDTTINRWHTSKKSGRINASNPCSEYIYLDDSACNLASLNLMKFLDDQGQFDIEAFRQAVSITILAQEIIVDFAKYPTEAIARNSHDFRPLGLGYANLGALLMAQGLPYDGDRGRDYAATVTALMGGQAYLTSAKIAAEMGPFAGYPANRDCFLDVIGNHRRAAFQITPGHVPDDLLEGARQVWDEALAVGKVHGFRNGQVTVLAPTGTISFMMDCDTTGVEPDIALIKYKKLVGGGMLKIVNNTVPRALQVLGYSAEAVDAILKYIDENDTIEGAPALKPEDLPVFDCAFRPLKGTRSIHYMGHVKMMAAVQPFISGSISKTINMPENATIEDIENAYVEAWKLGVKCLAIYRDGCKRSQPLSTSSGKEPKAAWKPQRRRLPNERQAITHKFSIAGHEGYITVGMYEDGSPGEIFLVMAKEGSTISGMMDALATSISIALQYGVPLRVLVEKFSHTRFEPSGFTQNPDIPFAKSVMDYIFRWLALKFLSKEEADAAHVTESNGYKNGVHTSSEVVETAPKVDSTRPESTGFSILPQEDAPSCSYCGAIMVRNGACYKCANCGATSGCS